MNKFHLFNNRVAHANGEYADLAEQVTFRGRSFAREAILDAIRNGDGDPFAVKAARSLKLAIGSAPGNRERYAKEFQTGVAFSYPIEKRARAEREHKHKNNHISDQWGRFKQALHALPLFLEQQKPPAMLAAEEEVKNLRMSLSALEAAGVKDGAGYKAITTALEAAERRLAAQAARWEATQRAIPLDLKDHRVRKLLMELKELLK